MNSFKVEQIDHIHVFVPDQYEAAAWYKRVLGLEIVPEHEDWAVGGGPLTISSDGGNTSLALFAGQPTREQHREIAFRVKGEDFLLFLDNLDELQLRSTRGTLLTAADVVDHGGAYSIYFTDPWGNPYEVVTYDYSEVKQHFSPAT